MQTPTEGCRWSLYTTKQSRRAEALISFSQVTSNTMSAEDKALLDFTLNIPCASPSSPNKTSIQIPPKVRMPIFPSGLAPVAVQAFLQHRSYTP